MKETLNVKKEKGNYKRLINTKKNYINLNDF